MIHFQVPSMKLAEAKSLQQNAILLPVSLKVIVFGRKVQTLVKGSGVISQQTSTHFNQLGW